MSNRLRDVAILLAVLLAAIALGSSFKPGPGAPQQEAAVALAELQAACRVAVADERSRFSDALRLLQNLGAAVEPVLSDEQAADPAVAEAIEQAKERIREWSQ